jgi:hypothetical protein
MNFIERRVTPAFRYPLLVAAAFLGLTGCTAQTRPLNDGEAITRTVLVLLASQGRTICVDDQTRDNALAVYREMMPAPRASRRQLRWYPPLPLWPVDNVAPGALRDAELGSATLRIAEPKPRTDALDGLQQMAFDNAARVSVQQTMGEGDSVAIDSAWTPPGVSVRWWPLNIFRKDCRPMFELSNPVRGREIAFVTVKAEHWATLYALRKIEGRWTPAAEWSRWLY